MIFKTRFDIGDEVVLLDNGMVLRATVGKISISHTDSKGRPGETMFNNYMPQKEYRETYMCDETGVGSGSVWELGKNIFATEAELLEFRGKNETKTG